MGEDSKVKRKGLQKRDLGLGCTGNDKCWKNGLALAVLSYCNIPGGGWGIEDKRGSRLRVGWVMQQKNQVETDGNKREKRKRAEDK